jgi:heme/copper-type cytochrome/quinol oxidase subunit 2
METISNKLYRRLNLLLLSILMPFASFADTKDEIAAKIKADEQMQMYMEVACIVVFVGGVVAFLIWKSKHDKQLREKQMEQMKKIQAAKRRAA